MVGLEARGRPRGGCQWQPSRGKSATTADLAHEPTACRTQEDRWEHEDNHRRPHLALAGKTPAERVCELKITARTVQATA